MVGDGFEPQPMINFIENLYRNPSHTAVNELFLFLDKAQLPITADGYFIAYKIVKNDYKDIYSGKMDNSVGNIVSMPRNEVDDKRENTCSKGLHFCSRDYLDSYGSSNRDDDRCLLVKIDPAEVVSIPSDYDNAKGRTWRYEVVGEVATGWRATLPEQDYTSDSVVDSAGNEYYNDECAEDSRTWEDVVDEIECSEFFYNSIDGKWYYSTQSSNVFAGRKAVKETLGLTYEDLDRYEGEY
jgi:hypothetical protein